MAERSIADSEIEHVFVTQDPAEASRLIDSVYVPHQLRSRDGHTINFKLRYLESPRLTLGHLRFGADSELLVPPARASVPPQPDPLGSDPGHSGRSWCGDRTGQDRRHVLAHRAPCGPLEPGCRAVRDQDSPRQHRGPALGADGAAS